MTKEQIKEYIEDFALAAERAVRCGVDSLVIHGAHGQLPGCFLNKRINERTDEYGADTIENASRFTVELLAAVREKIKDRLAIEYRINANDMIEGSPSLDEVIAFVKRIEPYIDLLHVSRGMHSEQKTCSLYESADLLRSWNQHRRRGKNQERDFCSGDGSRVGYIRAGGTVYCGRKGRYGFYGARTDGRSDGG